ncbi:TPA: HNH endonuclease signature motif containing protein [Escherichia coli]
MSQIINWHEWFYYMDGRIFWKKKPSPKTKNIVGKEAGSIRCGRYKRVRLLGKDYLVHRIVWEMHNGPIPKGYEVDHIWHDKFDNRIENLRLVTHKENQKNMPKREKTILTGISRNKRKWRVQIGVNGKTIYIGRFDNLDDAIAARQEAEIKYGFHSNHGK